MKEWQEMKLEKLAGARPRGSFFVDNRVGEKKTAEEVGGRLWTAAANLRGEAGSRGFQQHSQHPIPWVQPAVDQRFSGSNSISTEHLLTFLLVIL